MKIGSLATALALAGCATWPVACSSDSTRTNVDEAGAGGDQGAGGKGSGGAATVGNGGATGGAAGKGGTAGTAGAGGKGGMGMGGADSGASSTPDASVGPDASDAGAPAPDGSAPDGATKGCEDLRCYPYPEVHYPAENPASDDKAMLGKFLFWEEQVGELDSMACGTCHRSFAGGSDPRTQSAAAHLPGPDGMLDSAQLLASVNGLTSDDIRGAQGVLACSSPTTVTGTSPQVTTRKPPSYFDAMFNLRNFWDGRAGDCKPGDGNVGGCFYDPDTVALQGANAKPLIAGVFDPVTMRTVGAALEAQSVGPPANSHEMACTDQTWAKIEQKLATVTPLAKAKPGFIPQDMKDFAAKYPTYPKMFSQVFGSSAKINANDPNDIVNSQRFAFAIATHERRLTSNQTPFDRWITGDDTALTAQQLRGYQAFMSVGRCQFCHPPPLFTDGAFHNIGFHKPDWDPGRSAITNQSTDLGKFKTPTLRNVGLREPFGLLHEGEGPGHDLNSVMQLYKQGGQRSDPDIAPLIDPGLVAVPLTTNDIADIVEFLRNGLTDPRVKDEKAPFDRPHLSTE